MTATYEKSWTQEGRPTLNPDGVPSPEGAWTTEPDKVHWIDPATDLDCLSVRNPMGAWCGYVGVPPDHPWHGRGYSECTRSDCGEDWCGHSPESMTDVHGGLTFASSCSESDKGEGYGICHVPLPGRPHDVWWFGFDCAHAGDQTPGLLQFKWAADGVYRDLAYVKSECAALARPLHAVTT